MKYPTTPGAILAQQQAADMSEFARSAYDGDDGTGVAEYWQEKSAIRYATARQFASNPTEPRNE